MADPGPGAAAAAALALSLAALAVWLGNPFAALLLVPGVHLWLIASTGDLPGRRRLSAALIVGGLALPLGAALFYLRELSLDPLEGAWYLFLLVTGHHVGLLSALISCLILGTLASVASLVMARGAPSPDATTAGPALRGPSSYAGPGSLGGTRSALPR